jgi:hypothetical protein
MAPEAPMTGYEEKRTVKIPAPIPQSAPEACDPHPEYKPLPRCHCSTVHEQSFEEQNLVFWVLWCKPSRKHPFSEDMNPEQELYFYQPVSSCLFLLIAELSAYFQLL